MTISSTTNTIQRVVDVARLVDTEHERLRHSGTHRSGRNTKTDAGSGEDKSVAQHQEDTSRAVAPNCRS